MNWRLRSILQYTNTNVIVSGPGIWQPPTAINALAVTNNNAQVLSSLTLELQ